MISTARSVSKQSVFVFAKKDVDKARVLFDSYFPSGPGVSFSATVGGKPPIPIVDCRTKGNVTAMFAFGAPAESMATDAGLTLPRDGAAITLNERPDWFTMKIQAVLRFLHLD
jgi:hypothetical protein